MVECLLPRLVETKDSKSAARAIHAVPKALDHLFDVVLRRRRSCSRLQREHCTHWISQIRQLLHLSPQLAIFGLETADAAATVRRTTGALFTRRHERTALLVHHMPAVGAGRK